MFFVSMCLFPMESTITSNETKATRHKEYPRKTTERHHRCQIQEMRLCQSDYSRFQRARRDERTMVQSMPRQATQCQQCQIKEMRLCQSVSTSFQRARRDQRTMVPSMSRQATQRHRCHIQEMCLCQSEHRT